MFRTPVHIRLYRGPERMVALVSEPVSDGSRIAYNRFDQIMAVVEDEFLVPIERTVQDVVWIHLTPVKTYSGALPTKVENVVAELNPQERSPVGYARPGWNVRHHYLDPDCLPDLLGGVEPDRFYWEHYTPEVITAWQRTGRPVPVTHDILEAQGSVTALQLLESEGVTTAGLSPELLQHVTSWLLHELSLRCSPNGRQMYEASGVKPDPAVRTTKLIPYQIPEAIQRRLDADPSFTDEQASLVEKGYQLYDALMNVDQYADHPRPDLESAIRSALTAHGDALISAGYFPWEVFRPEPAFTPRTFTARGRWDHAYLADCTWLPEGADPEQTPTDLVASHLARRLRNSIGYGRNHTRFGIDIEGNVLVQCEDVNGSTTFAVLWPTAGHLDGYLPADTHLVADGTNEAGDRPVYLARHSQIIGLLPNPNGTSGWAYGYSGGSPGTLAAHIESFLADHGRLIDGLALRAYLTNPERDQVGVDIDIDRGLPGNDRRRR